MDKYAKIWVDRYIFFLWGSMDIGYIRYLFGEEIPWLGLNQD